MKHIETSVLRRLEVAERSSNVKKKYLLEVKKWIDKSGQDLDFMFDTSDLGEFVDKFLRKEGFADADPVPEELKALNKLKALRDAFKEEFKISDIDYAEKTKSKELPSVKTKDGKLLKFLGDTLDSHITLKDLGSMSYVKWPTSIELVGPRDLVNNYTQFREGKGSKDDSTYLGGLGVSLKEFENWLMSKGARKVTKTKPAKNYPMYD